MLTLQEASSVLVLLAQLELNVTFTLILIVLKDFGSMLDQTYARNVKQDTTVKRMLKLSVLLVPTCHLKDILTDLSAQFKLNVQEQEILITQYVQIMQNGLLQEVLLAIHVQLTMSALLDMKYHVLLITTQM